MGRKLSEAKHSGQIIRLGLVIFILGIISIGIGAKGCLWWRKSSSHKYVASGSSGETVISGMVFQQTSDNNIVPSGGATVTADWSEGTTQGAAVLAQQTGGASSKSAKTNSDGSYEISGLPRDKQVKITITHPDTTQSTETFTTSSAVVNSSAILKGRGKKIGLIKKNQKSVFNTFDDTTMPGCQISIPANATESDVDNVHLVPTHQGENLNPLPDGYVFLAGADFSAPLTVTFASGKEAESYIILPPSVKAEELSTADIKLMEFINGQWVITTPLGQGKVFTTGEWAGYLGPDGATPAKLKGVRPWAWVVVQPSVARISGTVKDNSGNPIKGAFVFGGSRKTHTKSDGTYTLKNIAVIKPNTLVPINVTAVGYQMSYQFVSLSQGATVNNVDFVLQPVAQLGEVYGQVTNAANAVPIYGAMVTLQTNPTIRGMKYDDQDTATDLTDDIFYVIPPPGVTITNYKWMLTLPNGTKFTSTLENGSSVVLNHLATEAGVSTTGAYKVELEVTYAGGKKVIVSGGFLLKISGLVLYIADVKLPVSLRDQLILKTITTPQGDYRFINLPTGETLYAWAKADGFIASDAMQISALSAGEERLQNFSLSALSTDTEPPSQPGALTGTVQSAFSILLTWFASSDNVGIDYYRVYRNGIEVGKTTATSYLDSGLQPSTTYQYIIGAFDKADNSALSSSINVTTPSDVIDNTAPTTPTDLTAIVVSSNQINLSWWASWDEVGVTGYEVYRDGAQIATTNDTNYTNMGLTASTEYEYKVKAYDVAGNVSEFSNVVTATTSAAADTEAPTAPASLNAIAISSGQINITWTASTDNVGVDGYKVYRDDNYIGSLASTSYSDSGLSASTSYSYKVAAYDAAGNTSDFSPSDSATTDALTGNLVAYWKFDETSGTTAADSSGNGNNGSVYGATWSGGTLSFDGVDDYVDVGNGFYYQELTIECWIYPTEIKTQCIFSKEMSNTAYQVFMENDGTINVGMDGLGASGGRPSGSTVINTNQWTHIAIVMKSGITDGSAIYINGVLEDTGTGTISTGASNPVRIGSKADGSCFFKGKIDEVKIYDYARDIADIQADYDATHSYPDTLAKILTGFDQTIRSVAISGTTYAYIGGDEGGETDPNDKIYVVRLSDYAIVNTITKKGPHECPTVHPNGQYVYVGNFYNHSISVISTSTYEEVASVSSSDCGNYPTDMVFSPDGSKMWVSNHYSHKVTVLDMTDPVNPSKITDVSTSNEAIGITMTPDGNYVYVIARYNGSVDVISTTSYTKIKTISIGTGGIDQGGSRGILVSPDGQYVYAAHVYDKTVSVIRTSDNTKIHTINTNCACWDMRQTSSGDYIFASGIDYSYLVVIRTSDNTVVQDIKIPDTTMIMGIDIAPDDSFILGCDARNKRLIILSNTLKGY